MSWIKVGEAEVPSAKERLDAGMFAHGSTNAADPYWPAGPGGEGNGARFSVFKVSSLSQ